MVRIPDVRSAYYSHRFAFVHKKKKKSNKSAKATRHQAAAVCRWCLPYSNPLKNNIFFPPAVPETLVDRRILLRTYIYICGLTLKCSFFGRIHA